MFFWWKKPKVEPGKYDHAIGENKQPFGRGVIIAKAKELSEFVEKAVRDAAFTASRITAAELDVKESWSEYQYAIDAYHESLSRVAPEFPLLEGDELKAVEQVRSKEGVSGAVTNQVRRDITNEELTNMRGAALWWYRHSPFAKAVITAIKTYTLGRGVKFFCQDKDVMNVLLDFWNDPDNYMEKRQKNLLWYWLMEGDISIVLMTVNGPPYLKVRRFPADELVDIVMDKDDVEEYHGYVRNRDIDEFGGSEYYLYKDVRKFYQKGYVFPVEQLDAQYPSNLTPKKDQMVLFAAWEPEGNDSGRGMPLLFPVLKKLRQARNFINDRMMLNHFAAGQYLKLKVLNDNAGVKSAINSYKRPREGSVLIDTPNRSWEIMEPKVHASDSAEDFKMLIRTIGIAFMLPEHIISGDTGSVNYSAIRKADTPFAQFIISVQDDFANMILRPSLRATIREAVAQKVLKPTTKIRKMTDSQLGEAMNIWYNWMYKNAKAGTLHEGYDIEELKVNLEAVGELEVVEVPTEDVPITQVFPEMISEEPKSVAEGLKLYYDMGVVSQQTVAERGGFDWQTEMVRKADDAKRNADAQDEVMKRFQQTGEIPSENS